MKRKGQLEIGVTMMVLLVFFVLLIIALVVYFQFTSISIKETRQEILDEKFSTLVNSLTGLPELKCSTRGVEKECLDTTKLIAFRTVLNGDRSIKQDYLEEFGIRGLEVDVVYPSQIDDIVPCGLSYPACNKFSLIAPPLEGLRYTTPVSLYYPEEKLYKIGKLIIIVEVE